MAFRRSDSTLFAMTFAPERLATIDVATGVATFISGPLPVGLGEATAFDFSGNLLHAHTFDLVSINVTTGAFTPIAPLVFSDGVTLNRIGAMKFHPQTGALYGVVVESPLVAKLALINPRTGAVSIIGPTASGMDSLAIQPAAPTFSKTFAAPSFAAGASTTLTFSLTNPNLVPLTGIGFTDQLPAGLTIAMQGGPTGSCGGGVITAAPGTGVVTLSNASLAPSASCSFAVTVTASSSGNFSNVSGSVSSNQSGTGAAAEASVAVQNRPQALPQVFQNPGAVAIVSSQPVRAPTQVRAITGPAVPVAAMPVLRPPSTGDAGLVSTSPPPLSMAMERGA
jgi:uncharacterized repeat protein (TIGR01451 family)